MLRRAFELATLWQLVSIAATVFVGVAGIGYVVCMWVMHFIESGNYIAGSSVVLGGLVIAILAALRVPLALYVFFGVVALLGTAFLVGAQNLLLP